MEVANLPELFLPAGRRDPSDHRIFVHHYHSDQPVNKCRVALRSNLFSFLIEGHKVVTFREEEASIGASHFLLLRAGHCLMSEQTSDQHAYRSLLVFFDQTVLSDFLVKHAIHLPAQPVPENIRSLAYDPFLRHFVQALCFLRDQPGGIPPSLLAVKFEERFQLILTEGELKSEDCLSSFKVINIGEEEKNE
ncbi:MAG: AraC family transcriptional regulator N-terminal domain-containing protein, partial [Bacteroidota bacterium]